MRKKGIHGIGILLIFLAVIIMATGISALLLTNSNKLAEQGRESYNEVTDNYKFLEIVEVTGYDGREQILTELAIDVKLMADSVPLNMHYLSLSIGEPDFKTILKFRGDGSPIINNHSGYKTWMPQEFGLLTYTQEQLDLSVNTISNGLPYTLPLDLDGDGLTTDTVEVCDGDGPCPAAYDGTHLRFVLSGGDITYTELRNADDALADISSPATLDVQKSPISNEYGYITITGTTTFPYDIDAGCDVTLYKKGHLLETDLDDDGKNDYLNLNKTHVIFDLSTEADVAQPLGADLSLGGTTLAVDELIEGEQRYGQITIEGTTSADQIDEAVTVHFTPYHKGGGYYVTEHLIRDDRSMNGFMVPGDVVRFHVETYRGIDTDEIIGIQFFYRDMETISKQIFVGNTFPYREAIGLFPKP